MKNLFSALKKSAPADTNTPRMSRRAKRRAIAELRGLSDNQLKDIGIDRGSITHSVMHGKPSSQPKRAA